MKQIKIIPSTIIVYAVILCLCLFNACKKEEAPLTPTKLVREIFGRPEKVEDNGVISVEFVQPNCIIHYNFSPPGKSKYEEELDPCSWEKEGSISNVRFCITGLWRHPIKNSMIRSRSSAKW